MHMLSLFPQFFDWSWYVPFFFRLFLAWYLFAAGWVLTKTKEQDQTPDTPLAWWILGILVMLLGGALLAGIWVQLIGIITFSLSVIAIYFRRKGASFTHEGKKFYLLLGLVALSLVFLGPGPFAVDLPL